ncbi:16S rRNA (cytidine(1402)-2'-O)-methyltransferase [Salirhabdus sp. Marseille-P4669]|uniref:16S rRNA (cytidine(1402)-2'-O)-methyltransferase n=1 Tax=Salirhabdus sp. Marseille-P4669 TaxID=2042310 RepID=UPI000C7CE80C|nr:16S rRNA (cytidine(1402)-2'-O)-methyltransferase [Salirhabdus sp. Marseille-P4669]
MYIQKSFESEQRGKLYVVPTPIGNLEDITFRALHTLKEVDFIAAEDTRQTKKLLNHFEISTPLVSYHEHNKEVQGKRILDQLKEGKRIALVSDAGMPVISDPGYDLIRDIEDLADVIVLPGANAALCALVGSGLPNEQFYFYGFLPRKRKELIQVLEQLRYISGTLLFYESPHRIKETIKGIVEVFGEDRNIVLARELTKRFEEYVKGTAKEVEQWLSSEQAEVRGEFCLVVEGTLEEPEREAWWDELTVLEHVEYYIQEKQMSNKDAIKQTALDRDIPKREVYQIFHH